MKGCKRIWVMKREEKNNWNILPRASASHCQLKADLRGAVETMRETMWALKSDVRCGERNFPSNLEWHVFQEQPENVEAHFGINKSNEERIWFGGNIIVIVDVSPSPSTTSDRNCFVLDNRASSSTPSSTRTRRRRQGERGWTRIGGAFRWIFAAIAFAGWMSETEMEEAEEEEERSCDGHSSLHSL